MNVWLVTTGSSDVQLTNGSDDSWKDWYSEIKKLLYRLPFKPTKVSDEEDLYRLPARVLGLAYEQLPDEVNPKLTLPLLQGFTKMLIEKKVAIDQIIILMSDQESLFAEDDRETKQCPYWQDTCSLYPILEDYFHQHFPDTEIKPLLLKPQPSDKGLDDWDAVLGLVQQEMTGLTFATEPQTVYVSHQAGTPAISSAVQFSSLSKFGVRVRFLVSSEQDTRSPEILPSSSYLKGIRKQEAKALLKSYDYSGIQKLISPYLDDEHRETKLLLNAAIQWNYAKFEEFVSKLQKSSDQELAQEAKERSQHWWWVAYEAAYLGVVRLEQGNTVEAMFHSFRALEGLTSKWSTQFYPDDVLDRDGKAVAILNSTSKLPEYLLENLNELVSEGKFPEIGLYGEPLFKLFRESKPELQNNEDLKSVWKSARGNRNKLFHRLEGLNEKSLFQAWGMNSRPSWEQRLLNCLNLISDPDQLHFKSLQEASLMAQVHQKLESAIASL